MPNIPIPIPPPAPQTPDIHDNPANPFPNLPLADLIDEYERISGEMHDLLDAILKNQAKLDALQEQYRELIRTAYMQYLGNGAIAGTLGQYLGGVVLQNIQQQISDLITEQNDLISQFNALQAQAAGIYATLQAAEAGGYIGPNDWTDVKDRRPHDELDPIPTVPIDPEGPVL